MDRLAGQRQISEATSAVVASLGSTDAGVRGEAVKTIGIIGQDQQADDLVKLLGQTNSSTQRKGIEKSLLAMQVR